MAHDDRPHLGEYRWRSAKRNRRENDRESEKREIDFRNVDA